MGELDVGQMMAFIVLGDNPPCWPEYDVEVINALAWSPYKLPTVSVRRAFETIDKDRWYLVRNVYGRKSRPDRGNRMEPFETVMGIPRPRRGVRGYVTLKAESEKQRLWHHGMTYEYSHESSGGEPIGVPEPISIADAYTYWDKIRAKLRLSEAEMERRGMPKPRHHVIEGKPFWWQGNTSTTGQPTSSSRETVTRFRRVARSR